MTSDEIAAIRARINLVPWDNGIGCTLDGITYYAHGRSDDQDQALITTLSRLKSDVPALLDLLEAAQAEVARLRAALEFYAGPTMYECNVKSFMHECANDCWSAIDEDIGQRARAALDGTAEVGGE